MVRLSREERKLRTREQVLEAADAVFVRHGYHAASLDTIAEQAETTTGAIYSNFAGKADLFLAVWERRLEERIAELELLGTEEAGGFDPEVASAQWFARLERNRNWHLAALEFRLEAARDPELNRRYAALNRRFVRATGEAYAATRPGLSEEDLDVLGRAALAIGNGYALERLTDPEGISYHELARASEHLVLGLHKDISERGARDA